MRDRVDAVGGVHSSSRWRAVSARRRDCVGLVPWGRECVDDDRREDRAGRAYLILFDGGLRSGWRAVRRASVPVVSLGVVGTFVTAGLTTVAMRCALGFSWTTSGLIGAAVAPRDPAIMFSVLGRCEIKRRAGTILEGESGANELVAGVMRCPDRQLPLKHLLSSFAAVRLGSGRLLTGKRAARTVVSGYGPVR